MRMLAIWVIVLLGIAAGFLAGCLIPDCPDDWVCGPVRNGQYQLSQNSDYFENGELGYYFGWLEDGWATVEDGQVTIQYSRPIGGEWRVVYGR